MKHFDIPHYGILEIENVLLDMNGTIQNEGEISETTKTKITILKELYDIYVISADTRGNLHELAQELDVKYIRITQKDIPEAEQKNNELLKLGKESTISIGNGNNDHLMLKNAKLGILIVSQEGATVKSLLQSDLIFHDINHALDFLLDDKMIIATLRS